MSKTSPKDPAKDQPAVRPTDSAAPAPDTPETSPAEVTRPWLTTGPSETFGPTGHIVHLSDEAVAAAPDGLLATPTAAQLARL